MKFIEMLNDKTSAALGGVAAGVPGLLASGCSTRPCTACFACAASLAALGGIWMKNKIRKEALAMFEASPTPLSPPVKGGEI